jgi:hypothetical protein
MRVAVLAEHDRTVPDQSVVMVSFAEPDPALFLSALLNSSVIRRAVAVGGGMDSSPNVVKRLLLPHWNDEIASVRAVTDFARRAHEKGAAEQHVLDHLVGQLYSASGNQLPSQS